MLGTIQIWENCVILFWLCSFPNEQLFNLIFFVIFIYSLSVQNVDFSAVDHVFCHHLWVFKPVDGRYFTLNLTNEKEVIEQGYRTELLLGHSLVPQSHLSTSWQMTTIHKLEACDLGENPN